MHFPSRQDSKVSIRPASSKVSNATRLHEASLAENETEKSPAICQRFQERFQGWRARVTGVTSLVFVVLLINISFLIWALRTHQLNEGIATLHQGSCGTSSNLDSWIHLVINLLSTGMLSGSNYCKLSLKEAGM